MTHPSFFRHPEASAPSQRAAIGSLRMNPLRGEPQQNRPVADKTPDVRISRPLANTFRTPIGALSRAPQQTHDPDQARFEPFKSVKDGDENQGPHVADFCSAASSMAR